MKQINTKQLVLELFIPISRNKYECSYCHAHYSEYPSSTSNLYKHLQRCHQTEIIKFCQKENLLIKNFVRTEENKKVKSAENIDIFANAIGIDNVPLSILKSPFLNSLKSEFFPNVIIPSIQDVRNSILLKSRDIFKQIIYEIKESDYFAISVDIWSNHKFIIFGLVVKYLDKKDEPITKLLLLKPINSQKAQIITEEIINFITINKLKMERLVSVTLDNCPTMKLCHTLVTNVHRNMTNVSKEEILEEDNAVEIEEIVSSTNNNNHSDDENTTAQISLLGYFEIGCVSHYLQLIIKKSLQQTKDVTSFIEEIEGMILEARKKVYNIGLINLKLPSKIRWTSYFYFLKSVVDNFGCIQDNKNIFKKDFSSILNQSGFVKLCRLVDILEQFEKLNKLTERSDCFIGKFYYYLLKLENILSDYMNIERDPYPEFQTMCENMNKLLKKYFYENERRNLLKKLSLFLYPKIKKNGIQTVQIQKLKKAVINIFINEKESPSKDVEDPLSENLTLDTEDKIEISPSFDLFSDEVSPRAEITNEHAIIIEKEEDLGEDKQPVFLQKYWESKKYKWPLLYNLYKKLNTILVGNGDIERKFSILKFFLDWKRNRTKIDIILARMIMKENLNQNNK